ncbi:VCBS repeat-containing protein [Candidatus Leptofilum sp.]|uniref:VCBS repeat-containing protein n=1 Tax=Candidatus Leptofilum sp. TaxID=3241576 RepID=UPI003B5C2682
MTRKRVLTVGSLGAALLLLITLAMGAAANGRIAEPDANVLYQLDGEQLADGFGWISMDLGDITGDGIDDLLTTAPFYIDDAGTAAGKVYIYSGADGALLHTITGSSGAVLGYSANTAGDVNGDGVPDYVVGAITGSYAEVYSGADHSLLLRLDGEGGDWFGSAVSGAGDVNGDGYADLIVGARFANADASGAARLFSGADGTLLWRQDGPVANAQLGSGTGLVGDVTGDGVPDQVMGAMNAGPFNGGEAYVFSGADGSFVYTLTPKVPEDAVVFGQFFASGAGDYDADGTPDIFVADYAATVNGNAGTGNAFVFSGADGRRLATFNGREPGGGFGPGRASSDFTGDGYGDLVIGAWTSSAASAAGGQVLIISGNGPRSAQVVQKITGNIAGDNLGVDAIPLDDVDGDGQMDFVGTAVGNNFFGLDIGRVFVVAGGQNQPVRTP